MSTALESAIRRQEKYVQQLDFWHKQEIAGTPGAALIGSSGPNLFGGGMVNQRRQREAYSLFRNWVYTAVNAIMKRLASQPICAGELTGATPNPERMYRQKTPTFVRRKAPNEELQVLPSHPVLDVLQKPNPIQGQFEFLYFLGANLLITGEAYFVGGLTGEDDIELWPIPTSWIRPEHKDGVFTGYLVTPPGAAEPIPMPAENVARTFLPDPSDPKAALSPLHAILPAARIDDFLQTSQEQMFSRGVNPNLIVTIAKSVGPDGKDRRRTLTGDQKNQLIRAIREMWSNQINAGDPAIIDGLIESVHKLHLAPREMDWMQSGEQVKKRILQAYSLNPISIGEIAGANRAQATEASRQVCEMAINPVANLLSSTLTNFLGPMFDTPQRLLVWVEECEPQDPELELREWTEARKNGDVTRNEFRTTRLGLPAIEDVAERNNLLSSAQGMAGATQILQAMGQGFISTDSAKNMLMLFLEIDEATAEGIVGDGFSAPRLPVPAPESEPAAEAADDDEDEEMDDIEEAVNRAISVMGAAVQGTLDAIAEKAA